MKIFQQGQIEKIATALAGGAVVALPTETVFGLAVRYDDAAAIAKLAKIKERPAGSGKVFSLMLADADKIGLFATESELSRRLVKQYFPGELTLVLPKNPNFHNSYFDNFDTIGLRIPDHPWLLGLLRSTGPLIVTSANLCGEKPATSSDEAACLPGVDAVVVGVAGGHQPSTVARVHKGRTSILRQGEQKIS